MEEGLSARRHAGKGFSKILQKHDRRAEIMSKYVFMLKDGEILSKHEFDEAQNEEYLRQLLKKLLEKCPEIIVQQLEKGNLRKISILQGIRCFVWLN
jgi:predicted house-cleaning noncanonical NTP pyrophosphatase (MazG superfamily)